jgi:hypothetical protein
MNSGDVGVRAPNHSSLTLGFHASNRMDTNHGERTKMNTLGAIDVDRQTIN